MWHNVPSDMGTQQKLRSDRASAQSHQSFHSVFLDRQEFVVSSAGSENSDQIMLTHVRVSQCFKIKKQNNKKKKKKKKKLGSLSWQY